MCTATLTVVVGKLTVEATDTLSIELRPVDVDRLPAFDAGAHIRLNLPNGLVRSYSLVNPADDVQHYVLGVLRARDSRGGSSFIHEQLRVGDHLSISGPHNNFPLDETGERFVLIAGGIGVTAIYSMAQRLVSLGKRVDMLYCCRSREHAAWLGPIQALGIPLSLHFDVEKRGPPDLDAFIGGRGADTRYYCCGPSPMLGAFEQACARHGYPHAHIERFGAAPVNADAVATPGYEVELARSGKTVWVESGTRLLDALIVAGVDVPFSCEQGICGSCEMTVLEGEIDHRDSVLSGSERNAGKSMMVCVSGCKRGRLVLDC
ncbi:ferredoxin [Pandoraea terrae]|uniref:Ferredoxin n=1 Tax=Pandoraea terrae TaxID=1537710 RepID=A0A5E4RP08_9BURK|nr:PDR/VanB family oxidoreductase [Pandoraea terrae]VVD64501.1 ferredoxin [Pandoraea terrae]